MRRPVSPLIEEFTQQRAADATEHLRRQTKRLPLQDYREVEMTFTATAATTVRHGLGRAPAGWIVVDLTGTIALERRAADPSDAQSFSLYNSTANTGTAKVWVF